MRGEESVAKILEFAKSGKGGAKKIDHERWIMKSEKMKTRRKPIKPKMYHLLVLLNAYIILSKNMTHMRLKIYITCVFLLF